MSSLVSVTIVTYNSARFIGRCLDYVFQQDYAPLEIIVVDNASTDDTPAILPDFAKRVRLISNPENVGFAAAHNQGIALAPGDWVLTLNPDVRLTREFIGRMVAAGEANPNVGSVSGKLLRMSPDFEAPANPIIDSTGMYFTPNIRHFDRGSNQPDDGRYDRFEYVFGASGAAALYRRRMIEDISIKGEFFDSDFFAYREDADVAWRAQLLGWKCVYTPKAVAYHVRSVLPENRRSLPAVINLHSVKNRFLLRIKNMTFRLWLPRYPAILFRDLMVVGGCLLRERSSLPAFLLLLRLIPRALEKRGAIMRRRRVSHRYLAPWFSSKPVTYPAPDIAAKVEGRALATS
ncbi:MAG: glycosyltransferase family 2 protein [Acidobacteriaceae bacterium]|nr:glycosyltransferase family 2 protein [Acidobacteriaceae bacterium]